MTIDLLFSRHWREDFPQIKQKLQDIAGEDDVVLVMEGEQLPISNQDLLTVDTSAFYRLYHLDMEGKKLLENPSYLSLLLPALNQNIDKLGDSLNIDLYNLAMEKKWGIRHEFTSPDNLLALQRNYLHWIAIPMYFCEEPTQEYLVQMKTIVEIFRDQTYQRDKHFFWQLKKLESEEKRRIVSVRGAVHSYLSEVVGDQGISFHGFLNHLFDDPRSSLSYKALMLMEISDEELVKWYYEINPK